MAKEKKVEKKEIKKKGSTVGEMKAFQQRGFNKTKGFSNEVK